MARTRERRRARLEALNARLRACRRCHAAGFLDAPESVPIAHDTEPDTPLPRILLVGQAPGRKGAVNDRPFEGPAGETLRNWLERGGIARDDFWRKIYYSSVTRCYPGRVSGARGDRLPTPAEQALCRPWNDEVAGLLRPEVVLLVGSLAICTHLGPFRSLSALVGEGPVRDGVRYLPLPHPSGISRWLNEPANVAAVGRAMDILRGWVEELGI